LFLSIWALSYVTSRDESWWGNEKIGVIEVKGVILDPQPVVEKLIKFRKNESIKAIVLRIDSPGGAVSPSRRSMPKSRSTAREEGFGFGRSVAASGGYYIACAADKILVNPGSITGSIG